MRATCVAFAATLLLAAPCASAAEQRFEGAVTRGEFSRIEKGMTRERVERIFKASSCVTYDYRLGGGDRLLGKQYRQANGRWTQIEFTSFDSRPGNFLRVDVKRFDRRRFLCENEY